MTADTNSVNLSERWWWYYLFCRFSLKCQSLLLCFSLWSRQIRSHSGLRTSNIICDIVIGWNYSCDCQPRKPCCGMWQLTTRVNLLVDVTVLCSLRWISHFALHVCLWFMLSYSHLDSHGSNICGDLQYFTVQWIMFITQYAFIRYTLYPEVTLCGWQNIIIQELSTGK